MGNANRIPGRSAKGYAVTKKGAKAGDDDCDYILTEERFEEEEEEKKSSTIDSNDSHASGIFWNLEHWNTSTRKTPKKKTTSGIRKKFSFCKKSCAKG